MLVMLLVCWCVVRVNIVLVLHIDGTQKQTAHRPTARGAPINPDGSVNFANLAVVRVLALATRLLVADRLLVAAWQALHRV